VSFRLIVIGAGPIGLAAALGGVQRGWDTTVLEAKEVGASMLRWGATRFFSPLEMNLAPCFREQLRAALPLAEAILTGTEFVESVLKPVANCPMLTGVIRTRHRVVAVGRSGLTRSDYSGHPIRAERPLRLLVETGSGEQIFEADAVIDASGVYGHPTALGSGGVPAPGERAFGADFTRDLGTLHQRLPRFEGKRILLVGHGHSAAHAVLQLASVASKAPATHVTWATRSMNLRPCTEVASDPLPERQSVVAEANRLAQRPPSWLKVERRASIEAIARHPDQCYGVELGRGRTAVVDEIVALTGYRPDLSFLSELPLEIAPSTEGTARLTAALANVTDCLSVPTLSPRDLESGEPGFHFAGAKSYGRARTFLLQTGYAQLETILDRIAAAPRRNF
jgi:thioredoxin reductase